MLHLVVDASSSGRIDFSDSLVVSMTDNPTMAPSVSTKMIPLTLNAHAVDFGDISTMSPVSKLHSNPETVLPVSVTYMSPTIAPVLPGANNSVNPVSSSVVSASADPKSGATDPVRSIDLANAIPADSCR